MPRELKLYLWDMLSAGEDILRFIGGKDFDEYVTNDMMRSAVERKFEIIGEALAQARQLYPEITNLFGGHNEIVAFRNRMIHGYFSVNNDLVWSTVKVYLPLLLNQVEMALSSIPARD